MSTGRPWRGLLLATLLAGLAAAGGVEGPLNAAAIEDLTASAGATAPFVFAERHV